jgi:integrase
MKEIMCTHLTKRGSTYYYRRKTPVDLIHIYGKEVMKSLGTKDHKLAETLVRKMGTHYDNLFASDSLNLSPPTVTPAAKTTLLTRPTWDDELDIDDEETYAFMYLKRLKASREAALANNTWNVFNAALNNLIGDAEEYIRTGRHPFEDNPKPMWKLEAQIKAVNALRGMKDLPFKEPAFKVSNQTSTKVTCTKHLLKTLVTKWATERTPRPRTVVKMNRVIDRFTEITNVEDVTLISKKNCVDFKDGLLSQDMSPANVNQYLTELNTILNFASSQAIINSNPATGLKVIVKESAKTKRLPFDLPSLNLIFSSPIYSSSSRPVGGKGEAAYWLPLLALFTGARLHELCQLRTEDIHKDSYLDDNNNKIEVWTLIVTNEGEDQELKNDGSRRVIPLHAELIRLGFIKYVNGLNKGLVFPNLIKAGAYDSLSSNWSKWFGRYLRTVVLVKDERMVFHSFRHCFKDYARAASIPSEIHNALTGHSSGNVADNYGSVKYPLRPLAEAMNKFKVTGLTLPFAAFS